MKIVATLRVSCSFALAAAIVCNVSAPSFATPVRLAMSPAPPAHLAHDRIVALLRKRVKYVFVIFQENRSFDSYFGSFPGARNLFSQPPEKTPGYYQTLRDVDGTSTSTIAPFRIGPEQYAADLDDVDHSFARMGGKMDVTNGTARMDRFAPVEEMKYTTAGAAPTLKAKQYGELTMAYEDCDTIPFLWNYANRFTLFDNYFQHTIGPSTPNAIDMIAGQTGETQWVEHPDQATSNPILAALGQGEPIVGDDDPFWGSAADPTTDGKQPVNPGGASKNAALNQTYASLPLTFNGRDIRTITGFDRMAASDLADVKNDVPAIAALNAKAVPWGWFEEGYDREPSDAPGAPLHSSYIGHHNAPQYFGYVANNPNVAKHLFGLNDFFNTISRHALPEHGGVMYLRGGYKNLTGLVPVDPDPAVRKNFAGDDDHPGYSDSQISEALVAREVNAISRSPYWRESAILITYDESEGDYDHVPPDIIAYAPNGMPLVRGPRIPLIVISPFAKTHAVSHEAGDHNSIIRLIEELYGLPYLADLPDEAAARKNGLATYHQANLGPDDDGLPSSGDLSSAFDPARLAGTAPEIDGATAALPDGVVDAMPPYANRGCYADGIVTDDEVHGVHNPIPDDFNPRPSTDPTLVFPLPPPAPSPAH